MEALKDAIIQLLETATAEELRIIYLFIAHIAA